MTQSCPLCGSGNVGHIGLIDSEKLAQAYVESFSYQPTFPTERLIELSCKECELVFFDPCPTPDPKLYEVLQSYSWYYVKDKPEFDIAVAMLAGCKSVLEVGAGAANFVKKIPGLDYQGLEFNSDAIEKAAAAGVVLHAQSLEQHASQNRGRYDAVISFQVLEHIPNPGSFLGAAAECLAPGGKLIFSVPNQHGLAGLVVNDILDLPPHHFTKWHRSTFVMVARIFSLDLVEVVADRIQGQHSAIARHADLERRWRGFFGIDVNSRGFSMWERVIRKLAGFFAKVFPRSLSDTCVEGPSIVACFVKPRIDR